MGAYMLIIANSSDALYFASVELKTTTVMCNYMPGNLAKLIGCFNTR